MPLSLLDLPRELRNEVYQYVYLRERTSFNDVRPYQQDQVVNSHPGLLRTCSQIMIEASPYLYRQCHFRLSAPHLSYKWIKAIGPRNASQIREILLDSNFLTHDIDDVGQKIAAQTWAKVFRATPGLHHLSFLYSESALNSWTKTIYESGQTDLADALHGLCELRGIVHSGIGGFHLANLNNKPHLESLVIAANVKLEEGRSLSSYFDALPRLRSLSMFGKDPILSPGFFTHVAPLQTLDWNHLGNESLFKPYLKDIVDRHASSLRDLTLGGTYEYGHASSDSLGNEDLLWLIQSLPHLETLHLTDLPIDTSLLPMLPPRVNDIYLVLGDEDPESVARSLKLMGTRKLDPGHSISLFYEAHDPSSADLSTRMSWEPVHQAIRELKGKGIKISSEACEDHFCNIDIHSEHVDQSGLIP